MASQSGLRFRLAGFSVSIPPNTLIGVILIAWLWLPSFAGTTPARQYGSAVVFAVVLLASVLLHELGHALAARRFGFPVVGITLWAFGGFTSYRPVRNTPGREAVIAVAGPAVTLVVALAAWFARQQLSDGTSMLADILTAVALANAIVAVFNMLPGLPLDGGSVLAAAVWAVTGSRVKGQRFAAYAGMLLAAGLVAVPLFFTIGTGRVDLGFLVVSVLVAGFLFVGARAALQQADAREPDDVRTAGQLAVPVLLVPEGATLQAFDEFVASSGNPGPVVALVGGPQTGLRGYVVPAAAAAVPGPQRASTTIGAVTRTVGQWRALPFGAPAEQALAMLQQSGEPVIVLDGENRPVGVIMVAPAAG